MQVSFMMHAKPDPMDAIMLLNMNHQVPLSYPVEVRSILPTDQHRRQAHVVFFGKSSAASAASQLSPRFV